MRLDLSNYLPKLTIDAPIRPPQRWFRHFRLAWIVGLSLVGLATVVALLPALMSARYRAAGEAAMNSDAGSAAAAFQQALQWSPNNPQIYSALAQSYLRLNQPREAIDALDLAYRRWPNSLLIRQELAQAYEAGGQVERADGIWRELKLTMEQMVGLGDERLRVGQYYEASQWYERSARIYGQPPASVAFRATIAAVIVGRALPQPNAVATDVYTVNSQARIDAKKLRWMLAIPEQHLDYGAYLSDRPMAESTASVMWWKGTAVALVEIVREGDYQIVVRARHSTPARGVLQVERNAMPAGSFSLTDRWQDYKVTMSLTPGLHVIGVRYVDDVGDAMLEWVQIQQLSDSAQS